jgi:hypothetical protein
LRTLAVEPGAVVGELGVGEQAGHGLSGDFAGPLMVGAVHQGRVGVAVAVRVPAAGHPLDDAAGEHEVGPGERAGEFRGDAPGLGPLVRGGRHDLILVPGVPHFCHDLQYICGMSTRAEIAAYIARYRPVSVLPPAACFARDVVTRAAPGSPARARALLWAAGKLADQLTEHGMQPAGELGSCPAQVTVALGPQLEHRCVPGYHLTAGRRAQRRDRHRQASLGSFLFVAPVASSRTRAPSLG